MKRAATIDFHILNINGGSHWIIKKQIINR
jgi:hypothetical protein